MFAGGFVIGSENKGAIFTTVGAIDPIGKAASGVGDGGGLDAKEVSTVLEGEFVMGLDFVKNNFGAELRKAGRKEGLTLLGVEGSFDEVAGVGAGQAGRVDFDVDSFVEGGGKEGKALEVIPVGVGEEKGERFASCFGPSQPSLAEA